MKIAIDKIQVKERIRKEVSNIDGLAADIKLNGLLNAITVMPQNGEQDTTVESFRLLAGLRRLKAAQLLGWTEIDVHVVTPADAEAVLRIEISENEQRMPFTFSEKADLARLLEEIETAKARERMSIGGKGGASEQGTDHGPYLPKRERRDIIGRKIGMSGKQYDRVKFIAENAPQEIIDELDRGERSIRKTFDELRKARCQQEATTSKGVTTDKESEPEAPCDCTPEQSIEQTPIPVVAKAKETAAFPLKQKASSKIKPMDLLSEQEREQIRKNGDFNALSPNEKITELQRQLRFERSRAATAESELARLKELRHNDVLHMESIIDNLKGQLETAHARIKELEGKI